MTQDEQICSLVLTRIPGLGLTGAFRLVSSLGSATRVFEHRKELSQLVPGVSEKIITALNNSEAFRRAEQELIFCEKNHIRCLTLNDESYPSRLRECDDAPLALFYRGNAFTLTYDYYTGKTFNDYSLEKYSSAFAKSAIVFSASPCSIPSFTQ